MPKTGFRRPGVPGSLTGRSRRIAGAIAAVGAAALAVGLILDLGLPGSSQGASQAAKTAGSTTVQRRDLVATDTESGTLRYAYPQTVFNRMTGTVTALPAIGQVIKPGRSLYQIDGSPVTLFDGTTPAYRDLTSGVSNGADVLQLNRDLVNLGFDPSHQITLNNTWQSATTTAVDSWQASRGETQTGTVSLGQIVFLPGPQRVTSVNTVLGSTGGSGSGSSGSTATTGTATGASTKPVTPAPEFVSLTTKPAAAAAPSVARAAACPAGSSKTTAGQPCCPATGSSPHSSSTTPPPATPACKPAPSGKPASGSAQTVAALIALLKAETLELKPGKTTPAASTGTTSGRSATGLSSAGSAGAAPAASSRSAASGASSAGAASSGASAGGGSAASASSGAGSATSILGTTSTQLVVTVSLDATKQSEAVVGEPVTVQLPNGNTVDGKITQVSPVAQTSSSSSSSSAAAGGGASSSTPAATVPITITLNGRRPAVGLDQAAVSVNFQQQVANNVLSVPVTALLATAGGGYSVQEAGAPHRLIPVTTGLFAAGYVQISGSQIYSGLQVTDSQG